MLYNDVYAGPQSHITSRSGTVSFSLSLLTTFRFRHSSLPGCNLVCYNLASLCSPLSDARPPGMHPHWSNLASLHSASCLSKFTRGCTLLTCLFSSAFIAFHLQSVSLLCCSLTCHCSEDSNALCCLW